VLFAATDMCSMYCRHCTRRRNVGTTERHATEKEIDDAITYLERSPEVRDVLISGGDPLTMSDDRLEAILARVRAVPHVEIVRIGTRMPVVCPQRVTPELCATLERHHPLFLNTHFNTPKELTEASREACARLAGAGIPLGNQSVLLRGVNDCAHVMKELVQGLLLFRVRPYYIYQCDDETGIGHFRTSVSKGIEIMESLRGHTSGLAQPLYIIEAIGGGGKTPIMPQYLLSQAPDAVVIRNYEGIISVYREPDDYHDSQVPCEICASGEDPRVGVAGLIGSDDVTLDHVTEKRLEKVRVRKERMADIHGRQEVRPFLEGRRPSAPTGEPSA
jgi:lysine 2,3-aminomutase